MTNVIEAKSIEVHFPGCDALRGVDLNVKQGTVFALLGENGAGKTTLIKILTGFLKPTKGTCSVLGMDPATDAVEIRRRVGYVSDAPAMYDWMQVNEIGWFAASFYPAGFIERFNDALAKFELPYGRKIKHLSKGQRAKVALALALAHDPELLIMDEPTSGLDPLVRREFLESMLDRVATGRTVLLSSHQMSEVERVADEIAILHQGRFRIVDSLAVIREELSEVTISMDDPLIELPLIEAPAELFSETNDGRQRRLIVRGLTEEQRDALENAIGVTSVRVRPASLDELFTACIRGGNMKPSQPTSQRTQSTPQNV